LRKSAISASRSPASHNHRPHRSEYSVPFAGAAILQLPHFVFQRPPLRFAPGSTCNPGALHVQLTLRSTPASPPVNLVTSRLRFRQRQSFKCQFVAVAACPQSAAPARHDSSASVRVPPASSDKSPEVFALRPPGRPLSPPAIILRRNNFARASESCAAASLTFNSSSS